MAAEFAQLAEGISVDAKPNEVYLMLHRTKSTLRRPRSSFCALKNLVLNSKALKKEGFLAGSNRCRDYGGPVCFSC